MSKHLVMMKGFKEPVNACCMPATVLSVLCSLVYLIILYPIRQVLLVSPFYG